MLVVVGAHRRPRLVRVPVLATGTGTATIAAARPIQHHFGRGAIALALSCATGALARTAGAGAVTVVGMFHDATRARWTKLRVVSHRSTSGRSHS